MQEVGERRRLDEGFPYSLFSRIIELTCLNCKIEAYHEMTSNTLSLKRCSVYWKQKRSNEKIIGCNGSYPNSTPTTNSTQNTAKLIPIIYHQKHGFYHSRMLCCSTFPRPASNNKPLISFDIHPFSAPEAPNDECKNPEIVSFAITFSYAVRNFHYDMTHPRNNCHGRAFSSILRAETV